MDLLFVEAFDKMMIPWDRLSAPGIPLVDFGARLVMALGQIDLVVNFMPPLPFRSMTNHASVAKLQWPHRMETML